MLIAKFQLTQNYLPLQNYTFNNKNFQIQVGDNGVRNGSKVPENSLNTTRRMLPITFKNSSLCATVLNAASLHITAAVLAGRYVHENVFAINLGRRAGHTACAVELAEHYVAQDVDVFVVTHSTSAYDHIYADSRFFTQCRVFHHRAQIADNQFRGIRYKNGAVVINDGASIAHSTTALVLRNVLLTAVDKNSSLLYYAFG